MTDEAAAPPLGGPLTQLAARLASMVEATLGDVHLAAEQMRGVLRDLATGIEELRVAEEELVVQSQQLAASHREIDIERERYGQLFEFAPDGYVETDELGKILEANSAAARLFGVRPRFLIGKLVHSFIGEHDRRHVRTTIGRLRESDEPATMEVALLPRGGEPLAAEVRVSASADALTSSPRVRWLFRDVTERLKLDHELQQLHADVDLLSSLADMARLVEDDDPTAAKLAQLVQLAAKTTDSAAGITMLDVSRAGTARAASDEVAAELCDLQLEHGGPGMHAIETGRPETHDVADLDPWPELAAAARRLGIEWSVSHPLPESVDGRGVLNLYGRGPSDAASRAATLLAEHAASIISNQRVYLSARSLAHHLQVALDSRGVIDQAKGILIATQRCSPDEAFDLLRRASQRENRELREMAEEIVQRAATPDG